jgi:hypothetical protein
MQETIEGLLVLAFSAVNGMLEKQNEPIWSVLVVLCRNL